MLYDDYIDIEMFSWKFNIYCYVESEDYIYIVNWNISFYMVGESVFVNMLIWFWILEEMCLDLLIVKCMFIDYVLLLDVVIK